MKRLFGFICITVMILSMSMTALAGDIPESLIWNDEAQIFFGEVIDYYPDKDEPSISVSPVKKIKGDVNIGSKQTYLKPNPMGGAEIVEGNVYLCVYYDEVNPFDIFEVTSYDTKTLKVKGIQGDMWERFQEYINNGEYERAELERTGNQASEESEYSKLPPINSGNYIIFQNIMFAWVLPFIIGAILRLIFIKWKKGYIISGVFVVAIIGLWIYAKYLVSHGVDGTIMLLPWMATMLTVGSLLVGGISLLIKKLKK